MKCILTLLALFVVIFHAEGAYAQVNLYPGGPSDPRDWIDEFDHLTGQELEVHKTTYFKLCEIRRFFCGKAKVVMVAAAVFTIGLLIIIGKITWYRVIVVVFGMVLFLSAELVAIQLTTFPPSPGVVYACYCFENMEQIVPVSFGRSSND